MALSARQRRANAKFPGEFVGHAFGRGRFVDAAGNRISEGRFWRITARASGPQPLPATIQTRLTKVRAFVAAEETHAAREEKRQRERELSARLARIRAFKVPRLRPAPPADPLDQQIDAQLRLQDERYRPILRKLYMAATANSEIYFGGKLALPIIVVERLANAQANCQTRGRDTVITFGVRTIETRSYADLADILLHEQIHQAIGEQGDKPDPRHGWHHIEFQRIANNIARQRGWPDCSAAVTTGAKAARYWPPRTHF